MTSVPLEDNEGLLETLEILADQDLARSIEQGLADAAAGRLVSHEDVWDDVDSRLRDQRLDPAAMDMPDEQKEARNRRALSSTDARDMARVREARRAFREFHAQCFWYLRPDLQVSLDDIPEIVRGLRRNGGRKGFLVAARLCR